MTTKTDFVALISFGTGGSWARDEDAATAVKRAVRICKQDWKHLMSFKKGTKMKVNLFDVTGHDDLIIGDYGVREEGTDKAIPVLRVEEVTV